MGSVVLPHISMCFVDLDYINKDHVIDLKELCETAIQGHVGVCNKALYSKPNHTCLNS